MFSFPKFALGLAATLASSISLSAQVQVFDGQPEARSLSRIFYYSQDGGFTPKGQIFMGHGVPMWNEKHDAELAGMLAAKSEKPMRWRFGSGAWTTLDSNVDLEFGDVKVPAGHYYAVLELTTDKKIHLVLLDPAKLRAKKMDAFQAAQTTGGIHIPLEWTKGEQSVEKFAIALKADKAKPAKFSITVRWGKQILTVGGMAKLD